MVIITGLKRSGTSMWMQILQAAGLPVLGDRFPARFKGLTEANPAGFWESRLRGGVYFATNPDPKTGVYLHPDDTRMHGLKVFVPGLVRTDHAFLHRVIATVRPWREYVLSMRRMQALEDQALRSSQDPNLASKLAQRAQRRKEKPPELEWWREMYSLVRDTATRRYPFHLVTYARLLEDTRFEVGEVLRWIGEGDVEAAVAAVRPELQTQHGEDLQPEVVDAQAVAVFDALYQAIHVERMLNPELLREMNLLNQRLAGASGEEDSDSAA